MDLLTLGNYAYLVMKTLTCCLSPCRWLAGLRVIQLQLGRTWPDLLSRSSLWGFVGGWALMLLLCLSWVAPVWAEVPLTEATVDRLSNQVTVTLQNNPPRPAKAQDKLVPGDELATGAASLAQLTFNDKSLLRVGQNARFQFSQEPRQYRLDRGAAMLIIPAGAGGGSVSTPVAVAAVQGSLVLVIVRPVPGENPNQLEAAFFVFTSPLTLTDPEGKVLGTIPVGTVALVRNGQLLGILPFDMLQAVKQMPLLQGMDPEVQVIDESELVQQILTEEKQIFQQILTTLQQQQGSTPINETNLYDLLQDPVTTVNQTPTPFPTQQPTIQPTIQPTPPPTPPPTLPPTPPPTLPPTVLPTPPPTLPPTTDIDITIN